MLDQYKLALPCASIEQTIIGFINREIMHVYKMETNGIHLAAKVLYSQRVVRLKRASVNRPIDIFQRK